MSVIAFTSFVGANSDVSSPLLPQSFATEATNVFTDQGALDTWKALKNVQSIWNGANTTWNTKTGILKSLFLMKNARWLAWGETVDAVLMQKESNVDWEILYTDGVLPKYTNYNLAASGGTTYPVVSYPVGIPVPSIALVASVSAKATPANSVRASWQIAGTAGDAIGNRIARSYVYTYVSDTGREGPPSIASNIVYTNDDENVVLTATMSVPQADINKMRVYVSTTGGTFNYLLENNLPDTSITVTSNVFGAPITTTLYDAPPNDLIGVVTMANGMLAAYKGNDLYFSEPYQSHAWPGDYIKPMDYPIKGLSAIGNMLFISTEGYPLIAVGNSPSFMSFTKLGAKQSSVAVKSMVAMGDGAMYASRDGIVKLSGGNAVMISDGIISERVYQLMVPSSIHAYFYRDKYVGFYDSGTSGNITANSGEIIPGIGAFILDPARKTVTYTDTECDVAFSDKVSGKLYICKNMAGTNTLCEFNEGTTNLTQAWRSKPIQTAPKSFSVARVWSDRYPFTFELFADDMVSPKFTAIVVDENIFRLPSGFRARKWQVRVSGDARINGIFLADSPSELK